MKSCIYWAAQNKTNCPELSESLLPAGLCSDGELEVYEPSGNSGDCGTKKGRNPGSMVAHVSGTGGGNFSIAVDVGCS